MPPSSPRFTSKRGWRPIDGLMSDEFLNRITVARRQQQWTENLSRNELPPVRVAVRDGAIVGFCLVATPSRRPPVSSTRMSRCMT